MSSISSFTDPTISRATKASPVPEWSFSLKYLAAKA